MTDREQLANMRAELLAALLESADYTELYDRVMAAIELPAK